MHEKVLFCCLTDYQYELYRDYVQGPSVQDVLKYGRMVSALGMRDEREIKGRAGAGCIDLVLCFSTGILSMHI